MAESKVCQSMVYYGRYNLLTHSTKETMWYVSKNQLPIRIVESEYGWCQSRLADFEILNVKGQLLLIQFTDRKCDMALDLKHEAFVRHMHSNAYVYCAVFEREKFILRDLLNEEMNKIQ